MLNLRSSRMGILAASMMAALAGSGEMPGGSDRQKRRPLCDRRKRKGTDPKKIKRKMQKSSRKANR